MAAFTTLDDKKQLDLLNKLKNLLSKQEIIWSGKILVLGYNYNKFFHPRKIPAVKVGKTCRKPIWLLNKVQIFKT